MLLDAYILCMYPILDGLTSGESFELTVTYLGKQSITIQM
jgi:hypothetical protein